jgi:hypothetical protein
MGWDLLFKYIWVLGLVFAPVYGLSFFRQIQPVLAANPDLRALGKRVAMVMIAMAATPWAIEGIHAVTDPGTHRLFPERCHAHLYVRILFAAWIISWWVIGIWVILFGGSRLLARLMSAKDHISKIEILILTGILILLTVSFGRCILGM